MQLVITPASREVHDRLVDDGSLAEFAAMGAIVTTTGCGACCGTSGVIPGDGMRVMSTANRNFKARMRKRDGGDLSRVARSLRGGCRHRPDHRSEDPVTFEGRARRLGDDINTDYIIASTRKRDTLDTAVLKHFLLEALDPAFAATVKTGDILVAGRNFGCGSAMEIAATVILAAGIRAVLAQSFSRTFFRNAINNGLLVVQCEVSGFAEGDHLAIDVGGNGTVAIENRTIGSRVPGFGASGLTLEILKAGGLVPFMRERGGFSCSPLCIVPDAAPR